MKKIKIIFLMAVLAAYISLANCAFAKGKTSDAKIISQASAAINASNKNFDEVCNRIHNNFSSDYHFKSNFSQVRIMHVRMRNSYVDMVYRNMDNVIPDYNYNYPTWSSQYLIQLNNKELEKYKDAITKYCVNGKYYQKDPNACSVERINSLF